MKDTKSSKKTTKKSKQNDELSSEDEDEFPVYPYEASIFYDVANN